MFPVNKETGNVVFQFHKGTIKTVVVNNKQYESKLFQFHKGTIKTFFQKMSAYI